MRDRRKKFIFATEPKYFHLFCLYRCMYFIMQNSRSLKEVFDFLFLPVTKGIITDLQGALGVLIWVAEAFKCFECMVQSKLNTYLTLDHCSAFWPVAMDWGRNQREHYTTISLSLITCKPSSIPAACATTRDRWPSISWSIALSTLVRDPC